jgi:hypothetical protein
MEGKISPKPDRDRAAWSAICCMGWIFMAMWNQSMMWAVGLGMAGVGNPLQDVGSVRNHRRIAKAAISDFRKGMKSTIADCMLLSAAGDEVAATCFTSSTAAASRHDEFEIPV